MGDAARVLATRSPAEIAAWARAKLARRSLAAFARQAIAAGVVGGVHAVEWGRHLEGYCHSLQMQLESWLVAHGPDPAQDAVEHAEWSVRMERMIARQREAWERTGAVSPDGAPAPWLRHVLVQNQIDNLPPGTLKSTLAMVIANAWIWLHDPRFAFGATSGNEANVTRDSKATRDLVTSAWYRESFAVGWTTYDLTLEEYDEDGRLIPPSLAVRRDTDAVNSWGLTVGGNRVSRTMSSGFTGLHVDCTFIDDPDDADKVWSEAERVRPQNRFTRAIENRINCERRSLRRVLQQRVHPADFTAYLLSIAVWTPTNPRGWAQLCMPAEFGLGPVDAPTETPYGWRDWRTEHGEPLHSRLSPSVLADKRLKLPGYEGQYNQNPSRNGTGSFALRHARWFELEGAPLPMRRRPEGCVQHDERQPIRIKLSDLTGITLSVDAANSLNPDPNSKVSAVGLLVGGCHGADRFILDDRTRVLGVSATYRAIYEALATWPISLVLVELKALGAAVIDEITTSIRRGWYHDATTDRRVDLLGPDGRRVRCSVESADPGSGDKVQRANAILPVWERGEIYLRDGAYWLYPVIDANRRTMDEGFCGEIGTFPASRRKDRMDALSQFVTRWSGATDARDGMRAMRRLAQFVARG